MDVPRGPNAEDRGRDGPVPRLGSRPVVLLTLEDETDELQALVEAVGYDVFAVVRQSRSRADPKTFVGRGKLEDVRERLRGAAPLVAGGEPVVVVGAELKPPVLFNLQDELRVEVWDRIRLILEIFRKNAQVKEAKLQVELARLRYELPFVHEALHRQLTGQRAGFMGGGEVEARVYETHLKRRTKAVLEELERIKKERGTRRQGRRRSGLRLIAIAGYTNSGKSTLLNELTGSQVTAADQVFSTLQTATRRLRPDYHPGRTSDLLLTDTVGFIRDLPPWLIDAFASTLEEITQSDAVLLVVDVSESEALILEKSSTALQLLDRIHAPRRLVVLLNKADRVPPAIRQRIEERLHGSVFGPETPVRFVSARTKEGLDELVRFLLGDVLETREAWLDLDRSRAEHIKLEDWLRRRTDILEISDEAHHRHLRVRCPAAAWGPLLREAHRAGAAVVSPSST